MNRATILPFIFFILGTFLYGKIHQLELHISEKLISPTGRNVVALAINDSIPGPTLRFQVGDIARIRVFNELKSEKTLLHWHGLLVPNSQDGVPGVTTPAILPGSFHDYEFELKHAGTYWYHSHYGLQEQRGIYGAIIVDPINPDPLEPVFDSEEVLILSEWTDENPDEIVRKLKMGDEWYTIRKNNQQSIWGAAKAGMLTEYLENQWVNMPPMDISDIAYDAFWINGKPTFDLPEAGGKKVKFRVINAGASSYFYIHSSTGSLTITGADGMPVTPVSVDRLLIGNGETYDIIVTIPLNGKYQLQAIAQDGSGSASVFLGEGELISVLKIPPPDLYSMDWMIAGLNLDDPDEPESARPLPPYAKLKARAPTKLPANAPVREMELRLTGNMLRYVWSFNGKTVKDDSTIRVKRGEILRLHFINDTMMHHPLHLHGHFFRLLNGQGDFAPLKHTFDVPPMGQRKIEFYADEHGDWVFHCHQLYHMKSGMTRVFSYDDQGVDHIPNLDYDSMNPWNYNLSASLQNSMTHGKVGLFRAKDDLFLKWSKGFEHGHYETDLILKRFYNMDWSFFGGYRWTNKIKAKNRAFAGLIYRLPFLSHASLSLDDRGDSRVGLSKELQLTNRITWDNDLEYDTLLDWDWQSTLSYRLNQEFSLDGSYHSEHGWGAGIRFRW
jgi:FtsP/CotA-like multicopper oxidase with cupredoxin domain